MRIGSSDQAAYVSNTNQTQRAGHAGHHHHGHKGMEALSADLGGQQGVSKLKDQIGSLVKGVKDGTVSEADFDQKLSDIADSVTASAPAGANKGQVLHLITRMARMEAHSDTQAASATDAATGAAATQPAANTQSVDATILNWSKSFATSHGIALSTPAQVPQGALLDGRA